MKIFFWNILLPVLLLTFGCDASRNTETSQSTTVTDNTAMPAETDVNTRTMEEQTAGAASSDTAFVSAAVWGNMALVKLGMMARDRAIEQPVQRFAIQMTDRHRNTNSVLMDIAHANKWTTPENLHTNQQEFYNRLETIERTKFDKAFMDAIISYHKEMITLYDNAATTVTNQELKDYIANTTPAFRENLQQAQQINSELK